ncbi:MAG TPA: MFS transporter [Anaerolineales bacterium]|jgi:MFS family permease
MIENQRRRLAAVYHEYPRNFWTLVVVTFIDRLGGALLFPFFALYITSRFGVGMTQVGILFALFSASSFVGTALGGALTDRLGRKGMLIFSLLSTSVSSVLMGLVSDLNTFFVLALLVGVFTDSGGPAFQAMVADLLPPAKRAEGYGIIRVAFNLSVTIGPAIGGFLAARSYLLIFLADAAISLLTAIVVYLKLPETKPEAEPGTEPETIGQTFRGYGRVLRDRVFMMFLGASILMGLVYMNMNTTLGVYLRDTHGVPESGYGLILSLNAAMVVLFQFAITRRIQVLPPLLMMTAGTLLYAIGFGLYGAVASFSLFLLAMVVITIGEMVVAPVSQAISASLAPEAMRGRYMAVFGYSFGIPFAIGPLLAGQVMDHFDPRLLWLLAFLLGLVAAGWFYVLHRTSPLAIGRQQADVTPAASQQPQPATFDPTANFPPTDEGETDP